MTGGAKVTPTIAREVTEWFPASIKPESVGWYQCRFAWEGPDYPHVSRLWWDGDLWRHEPNGATAYWGIDDCDDYRNEYWRLLKETAC